MPRYPVLIAALQLGLVAAGWTPGRAQTPAGATVEAETAEAMVRRSVERDIAYLEELRNYTFLQKIEERQLGSNGEVKKTETKSYDVSILYGQPYRKLIERDGRPLSEEEARKEQEKFDKEVARRRDESEKDRAKRLAREDKEREEQRRLRRAIPEVFAFRLLGMEEHAGRKVAVIEAIPRAGFRPRTKEEKLLAKFRGKLWIEQDGYRWVRLEAEVIDTVSFGWILARLQPGSVIQFEQRWSDSGTWLPARVYFKARAKLGLIKGFHREFVGTYSNYRRFQADSRVVATSDAVIE